MRGFIFWNVAFIDDLRKPVDFAPYPAPMDSRYPWAREESEPSDVTTLTDQLPAKAGGFTDPLFGTLKSFKERYPDAWSAYEQLKAACDRHGPLDAKTVELVKIAVSTAQEHYGGLITRISQARKAGRQKRRSIMRFC